MPIRRRNSTEVRITTYNYSLELRVRLKEYGITQTELSERSGINLPQLNRWLNPKDTGRYMQPSVVNMMKLEKAIAAIRARRRKR